MVVKRFVLVCVVFVLMGSVVGCTAVHYDHVYLAGDGKPVATKLTDQQKTSIEDLTHALIALGKNIDVVEARDVAHDAVIYPLILANQWKLVSPPKYHNALVNTGRRPRGLCYQWTEDMTALMRKKNLRSFDLHHGVVFRHGKDEHNTLIISAKGDALEKGIVLDPWRFSGVLYWSNVLEDKAHQEHPWRKFY